MRVAYSFLKKADTAAFDGARTLACPSEPTDSSVQRYTPAASTRFRTGGSNRQRRANLCIKNSPTPRADPRIRTAHQGVSYFWPSTIPLPQKAGAHSIACARDNGGPSRGPPIQTGFWSGRRCQPCSIWPLITVDMDPAQMLENRQDVCAHASIAIHASGHVAKVALSWHMVA